MKHDDEKWKIFPKIYKTTFPCDGKSTIRENWKIKFYTENKVFNNKGNLSNRNKCRQRKPSF